jgi:cytochrome c553
MNMKTTASLSLLIAGCGCSSTASVDRGSHSPSQQTSIADESGASQDVGLAALVLDTRRKMHTRLGAIQNIGIAIALSDLARAQTEARTIASIDEPKILPEWQPFLARVRLSAEEVVATKDLTAAAKSAANLAALCGHCHEALGRQAKLEEQPLLVGGKTMAAEMMKHQWAAARMFDGLIGPSDERWRQGAERLSTIHIELAEKNTTLEISAGRIRHLALDAMIVPRGDGRTALFASLLVTCAECHGAIRDR